PDGTSAPLEVVLLDKVSTGFPGVIRLLEWRELPNNIVMVLERPEQCQNLQHFIRARGFLCEEVARELFRQVLEAVQHCTSCGVFHRDIKPENVLVVLATRQAKLIDFGCGTYLQDTAYTHFAGKPTQGLPGPGISWPNISGPSLGAVVGILPFSASHGTEPSAELLLVWSLLQLTSGFWFLTPECQDLIGWCLSIYSLERPPLEDLFCDPWMQDIHLP
ncbi:PIM1 kinase, partial [Toxostoma redivivum]|nr:PIM1 kinase [Toxostoma redivivum]